MEQATAVGGDVLVVVGLEAEEVAEFVIASAEPFRYIEAFEASHTSDAAFHAAMILFQSTVLASIGPLDGSVAAFRSNHSKIESVHLWRRSRLRQVKFLNNIVEMA
jgi:hypothetical protein